MVDDDDNRVNQTTTLIYAPVDLNLFKDCPSGRLNERADELSSQFLETNFENKEALIHNLGLVIDELEGELHHLRRTYKVAEPSDPSNPSKRRVLKGISFLSLDFGRLSAENLELREALKSAQLENRRLHERCIRKLHYCNVPISVDSECQTDASTSISPASLASSSSGSSAAAETCSSGCTTPSIPADPIIIDDDTLSSLRRELTALQADKVALREFAKDYQVQMTAEFETLRSRLMAAIPENFNKLLKRYQEEVELRRALHNVLIELRGNIRVFCRVKPGPSTSIGIEPLDPDAVTICCNGESTPKRFLFDKVFGPSNTQTDVFDEVSPLIQSCLDGKHVSIFAYGHTGSGKTYTMEGPEVSPGISRRAASEIFYLVDAKRDCLEIDISCSMIEIYNEKIRDLLADAQTSAAASPPSPSTTNTTPKLQVRTDSNGRPEIRGVRRVVVRSADELHALIGVGQRGRSTAATALNECSSRSHALVMLTLRMTDRDSRATWTASVGIWVMRGRHVLGRLSLVDLAGSERVARSQVTGAQLQEAKHINRSLAELGNVVLALRRNQAHVPYRNCLLTRILDLSGDSKTLMIVQVTSDAASALESLSSLNFAEKISNITRRPKSSAAAATVAGGSGAVRRVSNVGAA